MDAFTRKYYIISYIILLAKILYVTKPPNHIAKHDHGPWCNHDSLTQLAKAYVPSAELETLVDDLIG